MILLPTYRVIYISCERTGTFSMFKVLRDWYGGVQYIEPLQCGGFEYWTSCGNNHARIVPSSCNDWFKFGTCRNPYSRAVSIWWVCTHNIRHETGQVRLPGFEDMSFPCFAKWLTERLVVPGVTMLLPQHIWYHGLDVEQYIHVERMSEECQTLPFWQKPKHVEAASNRTCHLHKPWREYYDKAAQAYIEEWAGEDFEQFGYSRDIDDKRGTDTFQTYSRRGEIGAG